MIIIDLISSYLTSNVPDLIVCSCVMQSQGLLTCKREKFTKSQSEKWERLKDEPPLNQAGDDKDGNHPWEELLLFVVVQLVNRRHMIFEAITCLHA